MTQATVQPISSDTSADGRHNRRVRNKTAVIDAYIDLVTEGADRPSVAEVAQRSGVSHRSVFRYFSDKDDLARSSIERQVSRLQTKRELDLAPTAPLEDRIEHLLIRRFELFEVLAPVARLMRAMAHVDPAIGTSLARHRAVGRDQLRWFFAAELEAMEPDRAGGTLAVVDVLCSFETADLLSDDLHLSRERSVEVLTRVLLSLLG